jgi:hypothetical protein
MKHRILSKYFGALVLVAVALLVTQQNAQAIDQEDNKEVSKLLEDVKAQAADLQRDSEELESFTRSDVSWQSHAEELSRIRGRVNNIGKTLARLQDLRGSAAPWQQEAIDRIIPIAEKLASNTTAAIEHLNQNPTHIRESRYQQYVKSNAEAANNLASMIRDFVEYGKTRTVMEAYERKLELPK